MALASPAKGFSPPFLASAGRTAVDKLGREGYESGVRAPITANGRSEGAAKLAGRLGVRSIFGASIVLGAVATAQGCGGSEFCAENSYECGNPNGGKAGSAGASGSTSGGKAGSSGSGSGGKASGGAAGSGTSGNAGTAGNTGGGPGDGGESGTGAAAGNGGEGGSGDPPPPECDPSDLEDGCVPSTGIFVSTSGDDDNDGTASEPLATISAAVTLAASTGAPIFVCGGTYAEQVVITDDGLEIHGGFACPSGDAAWIYDSTKRPRIAPTTTGYALRVTNVDGLTVTDLEFESADAEQPGESSIAVFVSRSVDVEFTRLGITAGNGMNGVDGTREESNHTTETLDGNDAGANGDVNAGGAALICTCPDGTMSVGGIGGTGGASPNAGGDGAPDQGAGKGGTVSQCLAGTGGGNGGAATAPSDADGAATLGILAVSGWTPSDGTPGSNGTPGQGGGGGAGAATGGGGGGACGGCGGKGGGAGTGGGASVGLATFRSTVSLRSVTIATGDAGDGGAGIEGEPGQAGGVHGNSSSLACDGGNGGAGADGAAGGGGAGGISVGILSTSDSIITTASTTFGIGMAGDAGAAAMGSTNEGVPGVADETLDAG
jgi:hypothetical protein